MRRCLKCKVSVLLIMVFLVLGLAGCSGNAQAIEELEAQKNSLEEAVGLLEAQVEEERAFQEEYQKILDELQAEMLDYEEQLKALQKDLEGAEALQEEKEKLEEDGREQAERIAELEEEIQRIEELEKENEDLKAELKTANESVEKAKAETQAEAASAAAAETVQENETSTTVYITKTGAKYHRDGCSYLKSKISISQSDAENQGYTPCSRCY